MQENRGTILRSGLLKSRAAETPLRTIKMMNIPFQNHRPDCGLLPGTRQLFTPPTSIRPGDIKAQAEKFGQGRPSRVTWSAIKRGRHHQLYGFIS